jgi:elongator complex protein 3
MISSFSMLPESFITAFIHKTVGKKLSQDQISGIKNRLSKEHGLKKPPTNIEIMLHLSLELIKQMPFLLTKPGRSKSGVSVVAIMTKPHKCPHGKCITCPGGIDSHFGTVPQSYTGIEPATRRAIRNDYDPYLQVMNRLEQYIVSGHPVDKIELIIMGGTFPSTSFLYQKNFIMYALKAMNDFSYLFFNKNNSLQLEKFKSFFELPGNLEDEYRAKSIKKKLMLLKKSIPGSRGMIFLAQEQKKNESSHVRCVSMVMETRPDYAKEKHALRMLELGATKVELGVQSPYNDILNRIERGHSVEDTIEATQILKNLGFKINYHIMPGLPGVSKKKDLEALKMLFDDSQFRPDMLKLYPCMVLKGTKLYDNWKKGNFSPLTTTEAAEMIAEFKEHIPNYVRIMRVQRDIPTFITETGVDRTNLRQYVFDLMKKKGTVCSCIRCREVGRKDDYSQEYEIKCIEYDASSGKEFFISAESDALLGFCRLRFPSSSISPVITERTALIRELHIYGDNISLGKTGKYQHRGWGKKLLKHAEQIAKDFGYKKMVVISGIGVRGYYRKQGYIKQGPYMVKKIV